VSWIERWVLDIWPKEIGDVQMSQAGKWTILTLEKMVEDKRYLQAFLNLKDPILLNRKITWEGKFIIGPSGNGGYWFEILKYPSNDGNGIALVYDPIPNFYISIGVNWRWINVFKSTSNIKINEPRRIIIELNPSHILYCEYTENNELAFTAHYRHDFFKPKDKIVLGMGLICSKPHDRITVKYSDIKITPHLLNDEEETLIYT